MKPEIWRESNPDRFYLDPARPETIGSYLIQIGFLGRKESIQTSDRAGDGNMNCTVRVKTTSRSFIIKQSRPWVEKYPQFEAPWDRCCREAGFYQLINRNRTVSSFMPRLLHFDDREKVLILEDMGEGADYTSIYRGAEFDLAEIHSLAGYLSELHSLHVDTESRPALANREMRRLNCQHIFFIPLSLDNGLDLERIAPGLQTVAHELSRDKDFTGKVRELSICYMADGPCLLHGDFFPGSLLQTKTGPKVIDPEFGYFGYSEFDPAVFIAHLILARQKVALIEAFLEAYTTPKGHDDIRFLRFIGVEIMRRLIGYAQLPIGHAAISRIHMLQLARELVLNPANDLITGDMVRSLQLR